MTEQVQENQVIRPIAEQTPVVVEEKKSNTFLIVILLIAILLIGAGAVYAGIQIGNKQTSTVVPTQIAQPTSMVVPLTNAPDETVYTEQGRSANWKTYTNTKYGYSFKYPVNYEVVEGGMETGNLQTAWKVAIRDTAVKDPIKEPQITIEEVQNSSKKTLEKLSIESWNANVNFAGQSATSLVSLHESKFLGGNAYEYTIKGNLFNGPVESFRGLEGEYKVIWFEHNGDVFMIMKVGPATFDQILSTFKFINGASSLDSSNLIVVANKYLSAYVSGDWSTVREMLGCEVSDKDCFSQEIAKDYGFVKYEIGGTTLSKNGNDSYLDVTFTDKNGKVFAKPPHEGDHLQLMLIKDSSGNWKPITWYFYQ